MQKRIAACTMRNCASVETSVWAGMGLGEGWESVVIGYSGHYNFGVKVEGVQGRDVTSYTPSFE